MHNYPLFLHFLNVSLIFITLSSCATDHQPTFMARPPMGASCRHECPPTLQHPGSRWVSVCSGRRCGEELQEWLDNRRHIPPDAVFVHRTGVCSWHAVQPFRWGWKTVDGWLLRSHNRGLILSLSSSSFFGCSTTPCRDVSRPYVDVIHWICLHWVSNQLNFPSGECCIFADCHTDHLPACWSSILSSLCVARVFINLQISDLVATCWCRSINGF